MMPLDLFIYCYVKDFSPRSVWFSCAPLLLDPTRLYLLSCEVDRFRKSCKGKYHCPLYQQRMRKMKTAQGCKVLTDWLPPRELTDEEIVLSTPTRIKNAHLFRFMRKATSKSSSSP